MIAISYDFQSGNYIKNFYKDEKFYEKYIESILKIISNLDVKCDSILEVGVGEATILANLVLKLKNTPSKTYGFDISWSRARYAIEYMRKKNIKNFLLFQADLFNIPLADNSIDIVYTSYSIEPNGEREREALVELMRVTRKYLILLEPAYEFANPEAKKRMERQGYIKNLYSSAVSLDLDIIEHKLFDVSFNPLNPTGLMIIKKNPTDDNIIKNSLVCPFTKTPLELIKNSYFSKEALLAYPIVDEVPCLLEDSAVIATHYLDNFKNF